MSLETMSSYDGNFIDDLFSDSNFIVIQRLIDIKWGNTTKSYYENLNYIYTGRGDIFEVDVKHLPRTSTYRILVECPDCNIRRFARYGAIVSAGNTRCTSCASSRNRKLDLAGQKFGKLTVLHDLDEIDKNGSHLWVCRCVCNNRKIVSAVCLMSGHVKTCGFPECRDSVYGKDHQSYKSNLSKEHREKYRLDGNGKYTRWQNSVLTQYNYTCQKCGKRGGRHLHCHHIYDWSSYPEMRHLVANGIVLCRKCHYGYHGKYGHNKNNEYQLLEWIGEYETENHR